MKTNGHVSLRGWLQPPAECGDERFRQEVQKAALFGLRLLAAYAVAVPPLLMLARFHLIPMPRTAAAGYLPSVLFVLLGGAVLVLSEVRKLRPRARLLAAAFSWSVAAVLIWFIMFQTQHIPVGEHRLPGYMCLLMVVTVVAVPFRPRQAALYSLAVLAWYAGCAAVAHDWDVPEHTFLLLLSIAAVPLAGAIYARRIASFHMREQAMRANEYLCMAQSRVLLSENAASLGRLAATLVHELNSPLGALSSAVDTMMAISAKQATAAREEQQRLLGLQADVRNSIQSSLERLQRTVSRIDRLTALDETEFQSVDLCGLLRDIAALVETGSQNRVKVLLTAQPLPELTCQPQQLSAAFMNVFTNAAKAMDGEGTVRVSAVQKDSQIEIRVEDTGKGISESDLAHVFEPGFKVAGNRVSTGNWSLFSCRQIIHGHGGEMYMNSTEGKGSTVVITLPF